VFETPSVVRALVARECGLVEVEDLSRAAIALRVGEDLPALAVELRDELAQRVVLKFA